LPTSWRRRREVSAVEAATVEAVFALAAELRAGRPPSRALALVATQSGVLSRPLGAAAAAVASGASATDELRRIADQPGGAGWRSVAAVWEVTSHAGGPVADVLDRLGEVLDADRQARAALAAAMAGSRATMLLLASLPAFGMVLGQALGAHPVRVLLQSPLGWMLLAAAAVLDALGVLWTRVIMRRALR
jgi:tight adherence protein B